jgi:CRP/FNR family transcriptional regulator, cyclic AMP receptor protein
VRLAGEAQRGSTTGGADGAALAVDDPARRSPGITRPAAGELVPGSFLERLTEVERESLQAIGQRRRFPRGGVLMFQGEPDDRVMALLAGRVKVTRLESEGREVMLSIRDPGDLLGELAFVDGEPRVATVTALEPVEALVTIGQLLRRHLETTPRVAVVLLEIVTRRFRESTLTRAHFGASDTMGRLSSRIVELAERYGEPDGDTVSVQLPISQEDLAAWTSSSRAGVAEALRSLRELGWIHTERRRLVVCDLDALRARSA